MKCMGDLFPGSLIGYEIQGPRVAELPLALPRRGVVDLKAKIGCVTISPICARYAESSIHLCQSTVSPVEG